MATVDNNPIASYRIRNREREAKNAQKALKRKENKEILIEDLLFSMFEQGGNDWYDYKRELCKEALNKRTQKQLKEILYG